MNSLNSYNFNNNFHYSCNAYEEQQEFETVTKNIQSCLETRKDYGKISPDYKNLQKAYDKATRIMKINPKSSQADMLFLAGLYDNNSNISFFPQEIVRYMLLLKYQSCFISFDAFKGYVVEENNKLLINNPYSFIKNSDNKIQTDKKVNLFSSSIFHNREQEKGNSGCSLW